MAKDLMRMLTEITPTQQPVAGTPGFRGMFGQQQAQRLQGSLGSLASGGAPSPQARMGQALAGLNLNKPEDLAKLAKIQQGTGDFAGAAQTAAQIKTIQSQKDAGIGDINAQFYTADSIQDYNRTFQQTGQKDFSLLEEIDPVSSAYKVGQMGDIRKAMAERSESFSSAASLKGKTDTMRQLLDTGLTTGALAGVSKSAKSFAQSLFPDVEFKGLKEAEVFEALTFTPLHFYTNQSSTNNQQPTTINHQPTTKSSISSTPTPALASRCRPGLRGAASRCRRGTCQDPFPVDPGHFAAAIVFLAHRPGRACRGYP